MPTRSLLVGKKPQFVKNKSAVYNKWMAFKSVSPQVNFPELEQEVLEYWKKNKIFEKSIESRPVEKSWTFLDGPPFITGLPHYGTLLSSIPKDSPAILKNFIKKNFISKLDIEAVEYLNNKLALLNKQGVLYIEERKCNFDVEIGRDMQKDFESNGVENYILWSTDSDFADPIMQIKNDGKKAVIFATSGKVAPELDATDVFVFDVKKIKELICFPREIPQSIKDKIDPIKSQRDSLRSP